MMEYCIRSNYCETGWVWILWRYVWQGGWAEPEWHRGIVDIGCMAKELCEPTEPDTITIYGEWGSEVSATVPCSEVERQPYPRGLVTLKNTFHFLGPDREEKWSDKVDVCPADPSCPCTGGGDEGNIKGYKIGLRWMRLQGGEFEPAWNFDERDFNKPLVGSGAVGNHAEHVYLTSSWGKPENGPGLHGGNLPAYQATLITHWGAQGREYYKKCECVRDHEECDKKYKCVGPEICAHGGGCDDGDEAQGCHTEITFACHRVCDEWGWKTHDSGWGGWDGCEIAGPGGTYIDLTKWPAIPPYESWYYTSFKVMDIQEGTCRDVLPVPIIEVQSIIK